MEILPDTVFLKRALTRSCAVPAEFLKQRTCSYCRWPHKFADCLFAADHAIVDEKAARIAITEIAAD